MQLQQKQVPASTLFLLIVASAVSTGAGHSMFDGVAESLSESATDGVRPNRVKLEIFYKVQCSHCLAFFQNAVLPLLWAELPADRVDIRVLPWVPNITDETACMGDMNCYYARDHMCALETTYEQLVSVASPELASNAQFVYCDLSNVVNGDAPQMIVNKLAMCAARANLSWEGSELQSCTQSGRGWSLLQSDTYQNTKNWAKNLLDQLPKHMAPFILLNGQYLVCDGPQWCSSLKTAYSSEELPLPGTLLRVVCSQLFPVPAACGDVLLHDPNARKVAPATVHGGGAGACENCAEVGSYHWRSSGAASGKVPTILVGAAAILVSLGAVALASRVSRQRSAQGTVLLQAELEEGQPLKEELTSGAE